MKIRRFGASFISILSLLFVPAVAGANHILSVTFCLGVDESEKGPVDVQNWFDLQTEEIHAIVALDKVRAGSRLKGVWIAETLPTENWKIHAEEVDVVRYELDRCKIHFSVKRPKKGWSLGKHRLDLFSGGLFLFRGHFSVVTEAEAEKLAAEAAKKAAEEEKKAAEDASSARPGEQTDEVVPQPGEPRL